MSDREPISALVGDLEAEHRSLDSLLAGRNEDDWATITPSPGWTVADQVGHLGYFDRTATLAVTDPDGFADHLVEALAEMQTGGIDVASLRRPRTMAPRELLAWWRTGAAGLVVAAGELADGDRLPWYGPSMGARSFLTARLMETWAHAHDVADAFGVEVAPTSRLRHIAQLGWITRAWSYSVRGRAMPDVDVRVELSVPDEDTWVWGDGAAGQSISGSAIGFCQVVAQRRHVGDTDLVVVGDAATEWMEIAQAFAGAPTQGPPARSRR